MSERMDKNRDAFRDEAQELAADIESALLELDGSPSDMELVGRIFRGMHTLKGSGAMFGYGGIAAFTHEIENVFDLVRNGEIRADKGLIDLTLSSLDQIRLMLDAGNAGMGIDNEKTEALLGAYRSVLKRLPGGRRRSAKGAARAQDAAAGQAVETFRIGFAPAPGVFKNGTNPLSLIRELSQLGVCRAEAHPGGVPLLWDIDPGQCYTRWELTLTTDKGEDAVRDVFIFIEDDCALSVERLADEAAGQPPAPGVSVEGRGRGSAGPQTNGHSPSIRVDSAKLDKLTDLVGELVTAQARLSQLSILHNDPALTKIAEEVEDLTEELRNNTLDVRMVPFGMTFTKFKRLARDLGRELGKEVVLLTEGGETELDKTVMEKIDDPIVHIIRNSLDHGIEPPEERARAGKPRQGVIVLSAEHSAGSVLIRIKDDGAGIDLDAVRARAHERGLVPQESEQGERELLSLLFAPGFTTAREVTGVSGRGVGMDVVKRSMEALRGSVDIKSGKGAGTEITLRLPLTLAIIDGLLVRVGPDYFVLPLAAVIECVELRRGPSDSHGRRLVNVRGELVPYINIREQLCIPGAAPAIEHVVIISESGLNVGIVVDSVIGGRQTVIKPLGKVYGEVDWVSGATVLGDGRVALILNLPKLVEQAEEEEAGV